MNILRLSLLLPFIMHKKNGKEKSKKCAQDVSRLGNKPTKNQNTEISLEKYSNLLIAKTRKEGRNSCADNYRTAVNSFLEFLEKPDIAVTQINQSLTKRYEQWLLEKGVCHNTSSCYMRSLRAIYNKAVKKYKIKSRAPFDGVFTGNAKTVKRAMGGNSIAGISGIALTSGTLLCMARDIFMFSYYAMGIPFIDVAHLKKNQIKGNILTYHRHKTGSLVMVKLESCMLEIIRRYDDPTSEYVFPILKGTTGKEKEHSYRSALSYYNLLLKKIGEKAGVRQPLTSYVTRHSWPSTAYKEGVDINVISQALGHSSPVTTRIYIQELDGNMIFKANKKVLMDVKKAPLNKRCFFNTGCTR